MELLIAVQMYNEKSKHARRGLGALRAQLIQDHCWKAYGLGMFQREGFLEPGTRDQISMMPRLAGRYLTYLGKYGCA
jgi:hypothetical protein